MYCSCYYLSWLLYILLLSLLLYSLSPYCVVCFASWFPLDCFRFSLYICISPSHVSFCARVNNIFFVSRLASCNPAPASHRLSISLRSLGTEVAPRLFPDSLVLGRFTRVLRGIIRRADQSDRIDSSRYANHRGHLTPEIGT